MPRPIATDHDAKRAELLDVAAQQFAQHGYPSTSMQQLADAWGTSKATLYHYHRTKDALLFDLLNSHTRHLHALAHADLALPDLIRQTLGLYARSAHRHRVLLQDVQHLPPQQRQDILTRERQIVAAFTTKLRAAYPARFANATEATARTMLLLGMMNWTFTWLKSNGPLSYADFAELVIQTLESGFTNP